MHNYCHFEKRISETIAGKPSERKKVTKQPVELTTYKSQMTKVDN